MRGFIYLADVIHRLPDGTVCMLRGGIGRLAAPRGKPAVLTASAILRIEDDELPPGDHRFELDFVGPDGSRVVVPSLPGMPPPPTFPITVAVPTVSGLAVQALVGFAGVPLDLRGDYWLRFSADGRDVYRLRLVVSDIVPQDLTALGIPNDADRR